MTRLSDKLFIIFNIVALISGCMAIGAYIYFQINGVTDCKNVVQKPLITMGLVLVAISLIGLIGMLMKLTSLLWLYSAVALLTLMGLAAFSVFIYTIGNSNGSSLGFKKHNLGEHYSEWLKNMVESGKNWKEIRVCLIRNNVCNRVRDNNLFQHVSRFHVVHYISPIENGCCKPPEECGYIYQNGTTWIAPKAKAKAKKKEIEYCKTWSNDEDKLCYNCSTCKRGVLEKSRMIWIIFSILDFFDITILIIMFTLGCCTRMHILSDSKYHKLHATSP